MTPPTRRIRVNDAPTLAAHSFPAGKSGSPLAFINSKPRRGLGRRGETPLRAAAAICRSRQRGLSPAETSRVGPFDNRGEGLCASRVRDAERTDAVDGIRHQFSRARPDLGLRDAQLPLL